MSGLFNSPGGSVSYKSPSTQGSSGSVHNRGHSASAGDLADYVVGDRVSIDGTDYKGRARYLGTPSFADGVWVGVELPSAVGNCDGSRDGEQYFPCKKNHGMFLLANACSKIQPKASPFKAPGAFSQTVLVSSNAKHMLHVPPAPQSPAAPAPAPASSSLRTASPPPNTRPSALLRQSSPEKSASRAEAKRGSSGSVARTPPPPPPPSASLALALGRQPNSAASASASASGGGAVSQKDLADVIERVVSLEKAQRETGRALGSILTLVEGMAAQESGQQDTLAKIAELAKKAQQELSK